MLCASVRLDAHNRIRRQMLLLAVHIERTGGENIKKFIFARIKNNETHTCAFATIR